MKEEKVMLVDGMALLFRGFYATAYRGNFMRNDSGVPMNGLHGFLRYMMDAVKTFEPSHVICCWDMGSITFRTELYEHYKGNREAPPEELIPQFDLVKEVTETLGIPNVGIKGYEADDCIGTLAHQFSKEMPVEILTGDQDILQLVDQQISVIIMKKGHGNYAVYEPESFYEEKGIQPAQMVDLKGLMGDPSDHYPGVKGIGEKTALKLLREYGTIEGILENLEKLPKGIRTKIENNLDMLHLSRRLATIHCEAPVGCELQEASWTVDHDHVKRRFEELEFQKLMRLIG